MNDFCIHFFLCNLFISIILTAMLLTKKAAWRCLSGKSQYQLWLLLPIILTLPFLPIRPAGPVKLAGLLRFLASTDSPDTDTAAAFTDAGRASADWIQDFSVSVTRDAPSVAGCLLSAVWVIGMLVMTGLIIRSAVNLCRLERSALPLQNPKAGTVYRDCRACLGIKRNIPIYSTAFLKSPVIVGFIRPRIYLPIRLLSDFKESDLRYMLLHELQHYRHKDALLNNLMNLAAVIYWFNPLVWLVIKEVRTDREIACDTAVLEMLDEADYMDYGNTLLNFARKISFSPFSLTAGIGGNAPQIRKRIVNIAGYRPKTRRRRFFERILFLLIAAAILESTAFLPVMAADTAFSLPKGETVRKEELSAFFSGQEGCFVLYDLSEETWEIYNESLASKRLSPDSTYKIYSALCALENKIVAPEASDLSWNGQTYSFPQWNHDQTLDTAMQNSVNWYFQELDQRTGYAALKRFYRSIGYGNENLSGGISEFWLESSLKISALEQVELLKKLYTNEFGFDDRNIRAVKDALRLSDYGETVLSGKTGTGIVDGQSINGWFIGYEESGDRVRFFAVNVQGADGLKAAEIAMEILKTKYGVRI